MRSFHLLFAVMFLLIIGFTVAAGQEIINVTEADIAWDPVTHLTDNTPIPSGDRLEYEVWIKAAKGRPLLLGTTKEPKFHVILPGKNFYTVGVRTKHTSAGGKVTYSEINWGHVTGRGTPKPFILSSTQQPSAPESPERAAAEPLPWPDFEFSLMEDFEGALPGWLKIDTSSIINIRDAKAKFNGKYGMSINMSDANRGLLFYDIGSDKTSVSVGFWFRTPTSLPNTAWSTFFLVFSAQNKNVMSVNLFNNNGKTMLRLFDGSTHTNGPQVSLNTWYWITLKIVQNGTSSLRIYNASQKQVGVDATKKGSDNACRFIAFNKGPGQYGSNLSEYFDDFVADWAKAKFPLNGWIQPQSKP